MGTDKLNCLTREDEELLLKFLDGESSFFETRRARKLISQSQSARNFVASIDQIGTLTEAWHGDLIRENRQKPLDLWEQVSRRIDEEQRLALFHGERSVATDRSEVNVYQQIFSWIDRQLLVSRAAWGISGATVAACLTFLLMRPGTHSSLTTELAGNNSLGAPRIIGHSVDLDLSDENQPLITQTAMQRQMDQVYMKRAKRRALSDSARNFRSGDLEFNSPFDIEWMRSDGQVRLIQDPLRGSTIIWVNPPSTTRKIDKVSEFPAAFK